MKKFLVIISILFLSFLVSCGEQEVNINEEEEKELGKIVIKYNVDESIITKEYASLDNFELFTPTKEGYDFVGWYLYDDYSEKLVIEDLEMPSSTQDNLVYVYAKWQVKRFTVRFYCNGQTILTQTVEYGLSAKEPTPIIKNGYIFKNWDKDFSCVTSDLEIDAIYEVYTNTTNVLVVLGNWMNDNGTISATMRKRLELAILADGQFNPAYIIVSGGMANSKAGISEAQAMYDYLIEHGIDKNKIIKEDKSMSTQQNAIYTMKILENIDFNNLIIVSTMEHFVSYGAISFFNSAINDNAICKAKGFNVMIFTNY